MRLNITTAVVRAREIAIHDATVGPGILEGVMEDEGMNESLLGSLADGLASAVGPAVDRLVPQGASEIAHLLNTGSAYWPGTQAPSMEVEATAVEPISVELHELLRPARRPDAEPAVPREGSPVTFPWPASAFIGRFGGL